MNMEGKDNCTLSRAAISDHVGVIGFKKDKRPNLSRVTNNGKNLVECVTIDSLNEPITFIKLDVEGAEVSVLKGAKETLTNAKKMKILIEVHPQYYNESNDFAKVLEWLVGIGYKFSYVITAKGKDHVLGRDPYISFPKYDRKLYKEISAEEAIPWACEMPSDKKKVLRAIMLERKQ